MYVSFRWPHSRCAYWTFQRSVVGLHQRQLHQSGCLNRMCLSVCWSARLSACLSTLLSVCQSARLSVSVCPPVCLLVCLSFCLSVSVSVSRPWFVRLPCWLCNLVHIPSNVCTLYMAMYNAQHSKYTKRIQEILGITAPNVRQLNSRLWINKVLSKQIKTKINETQERILHASASFVLSVGLMLTQLLKRAYTLFGIDSILCLFCF